MVKKSVYEIETETLKDIKYHLWVDLTTKQYEKVSRVIDKKLDFLALCQLGR